jgi:hypothetical protein
VPEKHENFQNHKDILMKIKKLDIRDKEECNRWEDFVLNNGYIYQSVKWCSVFKNSYNIESLYLYLENNGEIISALPMFHIKFLPFLNELVSIPHVEAGGFVNPEYYEYFIDYIKRNYAVRNLKIYQFKDEIGEFPKNDVNSLFMLDVPDNLDDVYRVIRKGIKRSIKNLLDKSGVEVVKGNSDEFVKILYDFNVVKSKEFGTPHHSYKFLKLLVENFSENCNIYVAQKDGVNIGASFIIYYGNIGYHIYHFIPSEFLKLKAGAIIYFHLFKDCCEKGIKTFSFGRSPKGSGVYKFKMQMHAIPYPLYIYNFLFKGNNVDAKEIKIISEKYSWVADVWSKLPKPVTDYFSPKLRKWVY